MLDQLLVMTKYLTKAMLEGSIYSGLQFVGTREARHGNRHIKCMGTFHAHSESRVMNVGA